MAQYKKDLKGIKRKAISVSYDLKYPKEVRERIREAKSEFEVDRILHDARNGKYDNP